MWPVRPAELLDAGKHVHERLAWRRNLEKRVTLRRHFAQPAANKQDEIGTLYTCEKLGIWSDAEVARITGMRGVDEVGTTERGCDRQRERSAKRATTAQAERDQRLPPSSMIGRSAAARSFCRRIMSLAPGQISTGSKLGASGTARASTSMSSGSAITTRPRRPPAAT